MERKEQGLNIGTRKKYRWRNKKVFGIAPQFRQRRFWQKTKINSHDKVEFGMETNGKVVCRW